MNDEYLNIATDLAVLLALLETVLSTEEKWELQVCIDYEEYVLAFEMLCLMLRRYGTRISAEALALLDHIGNEVGADMLQSDKHH